MYKDFTLRVEYYTFNKEKNAVKKSKDGLHSSKSVSFSCYSC